MVSFLEGVIFPLSGEALLATLRRNLTAEDGGCIVWTGSRDRRGYGRCYVGLRQGRGRNASVTKRAHRVAYEMCVGPIPAGAELDHLCRNRACCNPMHLEPISHRENVLRGSSPIAVNSTKTTCPLGHEYYSYTFPDGRTVRRCRTCHNDNRRAHGRGRGRGGGGGGGGGAGGATSTAPP